MRKIVLTFFILLIGISFMFIHESFALEAQLYAITEWTSECSGGERSYWDDMGDAWYDEITDTGFEIFGICFFGHCDDAYSADRRMVNGWMTARRFADPDKVWWGQDETYADEGDAVMICTHGGDDSNHWRGLMRYDDPDGSCYINAGTELDVGDTDLEFLHLSSCHSIDDNMLSQWYEKTEDTSTSTVRRAHQIDGFHGCMWIGSSLVGDYEDFADDAFDIPIGLSWMYNMYRTNINGYATQCPIAFAVGNGATDCLNRLTTEEYDDVFSDPTDNNTYCWYYYPNCDPECEGPWSP